MSTSAPETAEKKRRVYGDYRIAVKMYLSKERSGCRLFPCDSCKEFWTRDEVLGGEEPFSCQICDRVVEPENYWVCTLSYVEEMMSRARREALEEAACAIIVACGIGCDEPEVQTALDAVKEFAAQAAAKLRERLKRHSVTSPYDVARENTLLLAIEDVEALAKETK